MCRKKNLICDAILPHQSVKFAEASSLALRANESERPDPAGRSPVNNDKIVGRRSLLEHCTDIVKTGFNVAKNVTNGTVSLLRPVVSPVVVPIIEPIISVRPKEIISDSIYYTVPFMSHTAACINYVKRKIRLSVFKKEKESRNSFV